jgi:phosphoribosylaminoimidazole (AIR) synthetase
MFEVYNMGVGFCAVVDAADADTAISILRSQGKGAFRIGRAISDSEHRVLIPPHGLIGHGKHFRHE